MDRSQIIRKSAHTLEDVYSVPQSDDAMASAALGEGGFGSVFVVTHKDTGLRRAAKKIPKSTLKDEWGMLENEVLKKLLLILVLI